MSDTNARVQTTEPTVEQFPSIHFQVRAKIAEHTSNPELLDAASRDKSALVRDAVAANPHTPQDALRRLSESDRSGTRGIVAVNPAAPTDVLRSLAEDESWLVRESVMRNRRTPWTVLVRAVQSDPCPRVRERAEKTLTLVAGRPLDGGEADLIEVDGGRLHVLVPSDLDSLQGPMTGTMTLPIRIDGSDTGGSGGRVYDLSDDVDAESMYRVILSESTLQSDLFSMVSRQKLVQIWTSLRIPAYTREIWEFRFPELGG